MEKILITKEIAVKAVLHGSCKVPEVGDDISGFPQSDLIWAEQLLPVDGIELKEPLWTKSGSGYGDGYGSGYGSGYGDGSGYGYGYGYGDGSGSGSGDGYGSGSGDGDGSGSGYGYGYGDGDGSGSGEKYEMIPELINGKK